MASLSSMSEAVIGIILVLLCLGVIIMGMNQTYNKNYDPSFGINTQDAKNNVSDYQNTVGTGLQGKASENALTGVNVLSSYSIVQSGITMVINILTGQFIQNIIGLLQLGEAGVYLGWAFRLLFILALAFVLIKIIFKIKP